MNGYDGRDSLEPGGWGIYHARTYIAKVGVVLIRKGPAPACRDQ